MTRHRLSAAWWTALVVTEFVILWGAVVRATGSGAGCGANWPTCNGEIVPLGAGTETLIEFTHRLTSGLALLLVVGLWWIGRNVLEGPAARSARWAAIFIVLEAVIGAGLVLFEWTGDDASVGRAIAIAVHLANTFFLLGAIALTALRAANQEESRSVDPAVATPLYLGLGALVLVGAAGAVTALGDTLFPPESLVDGIRQDFSAASSFLVNLRVVHPVFAVITSLYLAWTAQRFKVRAPALATGVIVMVGVQVLAGFANLGLLAPVWMQVVHLLLADTLWVVLVLFTVEASRAEARAPSDLEPVV